MWVRVVLISVPRKRHSEHAAFLVAVVVGEAVHVEAALAQCSSAPSFFWLPLG